MATTTSRPSHAPNVVLIVGTAPRSPESVVEFDSYQSLSTT